MTMLPLSVHECRNRKSSDVSDGRLEVISVKSLATVDWCRPYGVLACIDERVLREDSTVLKIPIALSSRVGKAPACKLGIRFSVQISIYCEFKSRFDRFCESLHIPELRSVTKHSRSRAIMRIIPATVFVIRL